MFVVQRHAARNLHFDFRLERGGVLASWAVPKGIPLEPGAKSLAVQVEDHPLAYASFAGEIPKGQYGAGTVEIWDHGTYSLLEEKPDGQLKVRLAGERLRGVWTLVPARLDGKAKNWLLIRSRDGEPTTQPLTFPYRPMLARLVEELPRGDGWSYEVKFDGYRALAYLAAGRCTLRSRNDKDLGARFASVASALAELLPTTRAVIDGEICALDEHGRPSFSLLQQTSGRLVYYVFDLLELDGVALLERPLQARREQLRALVGDVGAIRFSESFDDGAALLQAAAQQGLEGIVAKKIDSAYIPNGRGGEWLKLKSHGRQEFLVAGYTQGTGSRRSSFGALVLAVEAPGGLRYAGNVGTGFDERELSRLSELLHPLERADSPFPVEPTMARVRRGGVTWVEPRLVVEVAFSEWTHDGHVRHPSYKGLRDDKPPALVQRERPSESVLRRGARELRLTNLDKLFWPSEGITKGELLDYYREVAPVLLPQLRDRPFTMRRYPDGAEGKAFFQKDAPAHMPEWIRTAQIEVSSRREAGATRLIDVPIVNDELALLWMVNMGCIDMNAWYSRVDRLDRPDFVLFDLDPTAEVPWRDTVKVALILKELLDALGLQAFAKTSGGKGLHVLVPLDRRSGYAESRAFAGHVASALAQRHPELATTQWVKARRRGVLIDANQNGEGKTIASAYSVRPRPGAPVSTPLAWTELDEHLDPGAFTMQVVLERIASHGDLFAPVLTTRQSLSRALRAVG
jgi:bifunctional non-homologous end joining protein LigD